MPLFNANRETLIGRRIRDRSGSTLFVNALLWNARHKWVKHNSFDKTNGFALYLKWTYPDDEIEESTGLKLLPENLSQYLCNR